MLSIKQKIIKITALAAALFITSSCQAPTSQQPETSQTTEQQPTETAAQTTATTTYVTTNPPETTLPEEVFDRENCKATITNFTLTADNKYLKSPIEYTIDSESDKIFLDVTYDSYIDVRTLKNAVLDITVTGGAFSIDPSAQNPDGTVDLTKAQYCIIKDSSGTARKYSVETNRRLCDLPIVNIYLADNKSHSDIVKEEYTPMEFYIDNSSSPEYSGTIPISGGIRGRGHSTWKWEKKPYRIKLDESAPILGLSKNKDWILLANYADRSLIRNTVAYEMGKCLDNLGWVPTQIPVDLFVNGEYRGVYAIGEHLEVAKGRLNIDENNPDPDTGYLLEVNGAEDRSLTEGIDYFHTDTETLDFLTFKSPKDITDEQRRYIMDYVNAADRAIISGSGYEEYIDVDNFCDWFILQELTRNVDCCFRRSCFVTKDKGGKLKLTPVWDYDLAFGNLVADNHEYQRWVTIGSDSENAYVEVNWANYLMYDKAFRAHLRQRWNEVKDDLMNTAMSCIDYYQAKIDKSQKENFNLWQVWGIEVGWCSPKNTEADTYELQIQYLKDFLTARYEWIDANI